MIGILRKLSRIGVTDDLSEREIRYIVFLNILVLMLVPFIALNLPFIAVYLPATGLLFVVTIFNAVGFGLTLLWTHLHRYLAARIWFGAVALSSLTLLTVLVGAEPRFHLYLLICIFVMFYKFPAEQRRWMYLLIGLYGVGIIGTEILFREGGLISDLPREFIVSRYYSNTISLVFSAMGIGALGYLALSNAEERLARDNEVIQDKSRQLESANKYKSHFLASASHDLRQPLHALNLFVDQLRGETDPVERSRLVGRIDAAVGSMNELFEALLDMTKLEAGILKTNPAEFPIARSLERIETTFADAARTKGVRLRVVGTDAWVASDPILLERILLNLVSNAVRYTERGGVVVGCRRRGNELRIDVRDTGPGIPEEQRQRIFAEYYQLSGPASNSSGGLGLGLAIVDRLGRLLGHKIELESRPARGSRFSVSVPWAAQPQSGEEVTGPALESDSKVSMIFQGRTSRRSMSWIMASLR